MPRHGKNQHNAIVAPEIRRQVASVLSDSLLSDIRETLRIVKETDSRSRVLFAKIHNMQQDVTKTLETAKSLAAKALALFDAPRENQAEGAAVIRDFLREKFRA